MEFHKEGWEIRNQNIKGNIKYKVLLMVSEYETSLGKRSNAENAVKQFNHPSSIFLFLKQFMDIL